MKRLVVVSLLVLIAAAGLPAGADAAKVMTWNIEDRGSGPAEKGQINQAARLIAAARPDVVGLQEVCVADSDKLVARLRSAHDLRYYEQPGSVEDEGMGCARGQAILSRRRILRWYNHVWSPVGGDPERRGYMWIETALAGRRVRVYNTHIGLWDACTQRRGLRKIARQAARRPRSVVLGDFNARPGKRCGQPRVIGPLVARFREVDRRQNRPTHPREGKIDYVFARGLRVGGAKLFASPASDHFALMGSVRR